MQNVEIRQLDLSPRYRAHLLKAQYTTVAEVLLTPLHQLRQRTNLSHSDVDQLVADLSQAVLSSEGPKCSSVAQLVGLESERTLRGGKISFGDPEIDLLFDGGVRVGSLTEIAGQSASGKTHLCLQLALQVQLPVSQGGLSGGALFISSEGTLSSHRLLSLATHMPTDFAEPGHPTQARNVWDYLDNVHTEKSPDVDTLEAVVSYVAPAAIERINARAASNAVDPDLVSLMGQGDELVASQYLADNRNTPPRPPLPIRLVILDSIAAPVRATHENVSSGFVERSKELTSIGDKLKRIAHVYHCAIVVVNQVADVFERTGPLPSHLTETPPAQLDSPDRNSFQPRTPIAMTPMSQLPTSSSTIMPPPSRFFATPSNLSRTSSTSSSYSRYSHSNTDPLPPPHVQLSLPSLLYTRFQSPHSTGASVIPPSPYSTKVAAALSTPWTNLINTRILCMISRRGGMGGVKREMNVVFGPDVKRGKLEYELWEDGVRSLGEVEWREELWVQDQKDEEGESMEVDQEADGAVGGEGEEEMLWSQEWEQAASTLEQRNGGP
ncbi:hypothetical protein JCM16303_001015 [Sporobolomyces ruberrimus]